MQDLGCRKCPSNAILPNQTTNLKDEEGRTALHTACIKGRKEIVQMLIDNDAHFEIQSVSRNTPLMEAIWKSEETIVEMLLEKGETLKRAPKIYSALTAACYRSKSEKIVGYLQGKNLDINDKDPDGWAPIHTACWRKLETNLAVVQLLLDRNADLEAQNSSDKTPLHLALEAGDKETTRMVLEKSENIEIADEEGLTPPHVAAQHQNAEAIGILIKKSANLGAKDKGGRTPLHHAIRSERSRGTESNCKSIVELFLNNYAPIDASEVDGKTPLHRATVYGGLEIVQFILRHNPNVDASDHSKEIALHKVHECLVKEGRGKITEELLKKADIGAKCGKGQTALHKATEAGCTEVVEVLLDHPRGKGFINSPDDSSFTPLQ